MKIKEDYSAKLPGSTSDYQSRAPESERREGNERGRISAVREQELPEELCLQELLEGREDHSCSDRALELVPPAGNRTREEAGLSALPGDAHRGRSLNALQARMRERIQLVLRCWKFRC